MTVPEISLRAAGLADEPFLRMLFLDARPEFASIPLPAAELRQLLDGQLTAQRQQYRAAHPEAVDHVIERAGEPVGRCWTSAGDREHRILDLTVHTAHRRTGVARTVLAALRTRAAAAAVPLRLSVWAANDAARRLYTDVGFQADPADPADPAGADAGGYVQLTWWSDRATTRQTTARWAS